MRSSAWGLLLIAAAAVAEDRFVVPPPDASRIAVRRDVAYRPEPRLAFDLYRPPGNDTVPLLVFVNNTGGPYTEWPIYAGWGNTAAASGLGAAVYSGRGEEDFDALIAFLRQHGSEYRVDPSRIVVWSGSANVRLGLPLAMDRKRESIRGAAVFYGSAEVPDIRTDLPVLFVRSGLDSTGLNRQIDAIVTRAFAANAPWIVENNAAGYHGFEVRNDTEVSREVIARTLAFAKSVLRPEVSRAYASAAADAALGGAFAREDWPAAVTGYRTRVAATPKDAEAQRRLGLALMGMKGYAAALTSLEKAWELGSQGTRDTTMPAAIAAARAGNAERAVHWLEIAYATPFAPDPSVLRASEDFAAIRDTALFQAFLSKHR